MSWNMPDDYRDDWFCGEPTNYDADVWQKKYDDTVEEIKCYSSVFAELQNILYGNSPFDKIQVENLLDTLNEHFNTPISPTELQIQRSVFSPTIISGEQWQAEYNKIFEGFHE